MSLSDQKTQCEIQCIYSGYTMSAQDFNNLIFEDMKLPQSTKNDTKLNVFAYDRWQRRLPKASKAQVPPLRLFIGWENDKSDIVRLLFATRIVRYHSPDQLDQNGPHNGLWHPDEADLTRLEEFQKFIEPLGGRIDVEKLEFTATKDKGWILV